MNHKRNLALCALFTALCLFAGCENNATRSEVEGGSKSVFKPKPVELLEEPSISDPVGFYRKSYDFWIIDHREFGRAVVQANHPRIRASSKHLIQDLENFKEALKEKDFALVDEFVVQYKALTEKALGGMDFQSMEHALNKIEKDIRNKLGPGNIELKVKENKPEDPKDPDKKDPKKPDF